RTASALRDQGRRGFRSTAAADVGPGKDRPRRRGRPPGMDRRDTLTRSTIRAREPTDHHRRMLMSHLRRITSLGAVLLLVPLCSVTRAQTVTATTGAINGVVMDSSNAVLPGVTITLSGQAEMGTPTTLSGPNGAFGFAAVPPGDYVLTCELSG